MRHREWRAVAPPLRRPFAGIIPSQADATHEEATMSDQPKPAKRSAATASDGFTDEERAAMKERAQELKAAARRGKRASKTDGEADLLAKIAEMSGTDRAMAERIHAIVTAAAPSLAPRTWYGMPAWARDGKVLCFFQGAQKFKTRYATLGFTDEAKLDDGAMWPASFALKELSDADAARIEALVRRAVG
jgi:uncharacterized protein YdhG (YjbR/CyaY superfamily)